MSCIETAVYAESGDSHPSHVHNCHQLILILSGDVTATVSGDTFEITAPALLCISNLERHAVRCTAGTYRRFTLSLLPRETEEAVRSPELTALLTRRPAGFRHAIALSPQTAEELSALAGMMTDEHRRGVAPVPDAADVLLRMFLLRLYRYVPDAFPRCESSMADTVCRARMRIEQQINADLSLTRLAAECRVSPCYLSRSFRLVTGYTMSRYRLLYRLACAREYLASGDMSVTEVCALTGFSDMSNFSRFFRREIGCTPREYRQKYRLKTMSSEEGV